MNEEFALVNGVKICYEIGGTGEDIVLVHGFGAKKEYWVGQFEPLKKHFRVVRFDNRGAGKSDRLNELFTMEMFANDIKGLMDALDLKKAHIIGWSLGGMMAQVFAIRYPEKVNKLILINTLPYWPSVDDAGIKMYVDSRIASYEATLKDPEKAFFDHASMSYTRKFIKKMRENQTQKFFNLFTTDDLIKMNSIDISTPQDLKNQANALKNFNILDQLPRIKNQTLIIAAAQDRQTPLSMNEKIQAAIPNSKLLAIEEAGHRSPMEKAPEINDQIIKFLKS